MLKAEDWMDLHVLRREGHSIKAIARLTGFSRNTVRRQLRQSAPSVPAVVERPLSRGARTDPLSGVEN
jgi:transposase